jgi:hypothetical protein
MKEGEREREKERERESYISVGYVVSRSGVADCSLVHEH